MNDLYQQQMRLAAYKYKPLALAQLTLESGARRPGRRRDVSGTSQRIRHFKAQRGFPPPSALVLLLSLVVGACAPSSDPTDIDPRDRNYPVPNPHTSHIVEFSAVIPMSLQVRFRSLYSASSNAGRSCERTVGLGVNAPYTHYVPLQLSKAGERYRGEIVVDAFLEGVCGWHFVGLSYDIPTMLPEGPLLATYAAQNRSDGSSGVDVWCMRGIRATEPRVLSVGCVGSWELRHWTRPDLKNSMVTDHRSEELPATITPEAHEFEAWFHEIEPRTEKQP